ncbi:hypothetical protein GCM10010346_42730 [Streptomyces chryseus]|uniref:Uncharacterized protein n=1 Tax=Streptomyces chryseus TaxID=68186 RepID=A0ABQ3DY25_9ACTN|nr:hypothetical protein GCM10010346_42730 [Streptomyces chryseus]
MIPAPGITGAAQALNGAPRGRGAPTVYHPGSAAAVPPGAAAVAPPGGPLPLCPRRVAAALLPAGAAARRLRSGRAP